MLEAEFVREIRSAWQVVDRLGLSRSVGRFSSLPVDEDHRNVTLDPNSTLLDIYRSGLTRSNYNFLLWDMAYFQFAWTSDAEWRLAFWPNPSVSGVARSHLELAALEDSQERGLLSDEEVTLYLDTFPQYNAIPPFRFEYSRSQYVEHLHPAAHFHIGRHFDHRWPSSVCLGPKAFTMLILRLYYGDRWQIHSALTGAEVPDCLDRAFSTVMDATAFSHDFSPAERRQFHFGRAIVAG
nr:DUF2290 domain-containing protein [uncultured Brevundimonas sp.]